MLNYYCSDAVDKQCTELPPGTYGLSNHSLDWPWPKVLDGKQQLAALLSDVAVPDMVPATLMAALLRILQTDTVYADTSLPPFPPPHQLPSEWEAPLSTIFVRHPLANYGTRTHTVVLVANNNSLHFLESTRIASTDQWQTQLWGPSPQG